MNLFKKAKKYIWVHDLAHKGYKLWRKNLEDHDATLIAVSRWHMKQIRRFIKGYKKVRFIYNPLDDKIFKYKNEMYNKNQIVWMSSPHKGLSKALELHQTIRKLRPKIKFVVYNPGYVTPDSAGVSKEQLDYRGVRFLGPQPCYKMWKKVKNSLCVFYPCEFAETFGLVASEANALRTPIATFRRGALPEVVSNRVQLVKYGEYKKLIDMVIKWHDKSRPQVKAKNEFLIKNVIDDWIRVFNSY